MLVVDGNIVYEIDEECIKNRMVSKECELPREWLPHAPANQKLMDQEERNRQRS